MDNQSLPTPKSLIHYDPERIDYSVTDGELEQLSKGNTTLWKDFCLFCLALGVPCLINAIAATSLTAFVLSLSLFLNYLFGVVGIILSIAFGIAWKKTHKGTTDLITVIKNKPKFELNPSTTNIGALQTRPVQQNPAEQNNPTQTTNR